MRPLLLIPLLLTLRAADPLGDFTRGLEAPADATAELISDTSPVAPGKAFTVGIRLPHPGGWHSYYKNSGGVELPPTVAWKLPEGFTAGPLRWPVPSVFESDLGKSIGYSESLTLLAEITPPPGLATGSTVTLGADVTWQYCRPGQCINKDATLALDLPVAADASTDLAKFSAIRDKLPVENRGLSFTATLAGSAMTLRVAGGLPPGAVSFIPDQPFVAPVEAATPGENGTIPLQQATDFLEEPIPLGDEIGGILVPASGPAVIVPPTPFSAAPAPPPPMSALLPIFGGMLLGGLILNLMPCVFPVIGLKIMGFVQQAGEDRRKIVLHGIAFTVGVVISFWVLSGILFALRQAAGPGQEVGWGYQLQNPWTVLVLMLLMFVLGLAMYGVFELGTSVTGVGGKLQSKQGVGGSFFSGVLATVVATPCSAPFLGAAIGLAMTLPAVPFFTAFTFMALGLALPYLVLSIFPRLVGFLPRPGPWMESFKQAMAFLLFATAGYLLWVYVGQTELPHMLNVIVGLTLIAIAAWIFGRWDTPARSKGVRAFAKTMVVAFAALGFLACKPPAPSALVWEKWSPARVAELNDAGVPVFIDFTAQWCATCQVNKKFAYTADVIRLMNERGIVALKADKTSRDPTIETALGRYGRSAIPVNVLQVPGGKPIVTPEVLTPDYLRKLFAEQVPKVP